MGGKKGKGNKSKPMPLNEFHGTDDRKVMNKESQHQLSYSLYPDDDNQPWHGRGNDDNSDAYSHNGQAKGNYEEDDQSASRKRGHGNLQHSRHCDDHSSFNYENHSNQDCHHTDCHTNTGTRSPPTNDQLLQEIITHLLEFENFWTTTSSVTKLMPKKLNMRSPNKLLSLLMQFPDIFHIETQQSPESEHYIKLYPKVNVCREFNTPNGCREKSRYGDCPNLHICMGYLCEVCPKPEYCIFSHSFTSTHNEMVLRNLHVNWIDHNRLKTLLQKCIQDVLPGICHDYNNKQGKCHGGCKALHLCEASITGNCDGRCSLNHDLYEKSCKLTLGKFGQDVESGNEDLLNHYRKFWKGITSSHCNFREWKCPPVPPTPKVYVNQQRRFSPSDMHYPPLKENSLANRITSEGIRPSSKNKAIVAEYIEIAQGSHSSRTGYQDGDMSMIQDHFKQDYGSQMPPNVDDMSEHHNVIDKTTERESQVGYDYDVRSRGEIQHGEDFGHKSGSYNRNHERYGEGSNDDKQGWHGQFLSKEPYAEEQWNAPGNADQRHQQGSQRRDSNPEVPLGKSSYPGSPLSNSKEDYRQVSRSHNFHGVEDRRRGRTFTEAAEGSSFSEQQINTESPSGHGRQQQGEDFGSESGMHITERYQGSSDEQIRHDRLLAERLDAQEQQNAFQGSHHARERRDRNSEMPFDKHSYPSSSQSTSQDDFRQVSSSHNLRGKEDRGRGRASSGRGAGGSFGDQQMSTETPPSNTGARSKRSEGRSKGIVNALKQGFEALASGGRKKVRGQVTEAKLCLYGLEGKCKYGPQKCQYTHGQQPYDWEFFYKGDWNFFGSVVSEKLEKSFRMPSITEVEVSLQDGILPDVLIYMLKQGGKMFVNFENSVMYSEPSITLKIRRLSTPSRALIDSKMATVWEWYFDDDNCWVPFGGESVINAGKKSDSWFLETKFMGNEKHVQMSTGNMYYSVDFQKFVQVNEGTKRERKLSRRPAMRQPYDGQQ